MALAGVELESLVSEPDALTTRPPPCAMSSITESVSSKYFYWSKPIAYLSSQTQKELVGLIKFEL